MKSKKKYILISVIIGGILLVGICLYFLIGYLRVKFAKIEVTLKEDLTLPFLAEGKVSDFILTINGIITDDYQIDTTSIGEKNVEVSFVNDDGISVKYTYKIEVVDTVAPVIWLGSSYSVKKGSRDFAQKILCGDNEDPEPLCVIEGEYDLETVGSYPLEFVAKDRSGNISTQKFTLYVNDVKPLTNNSKPSTVTPKKTNFHDVVALYKNDKTKIGIDVSKWQGDIDFEKIKNAGVEFVFIRVGGTRGTGKEYFVDEKFKQNIEAFTAHGIDVGIYFYSYANSNELARQDALWVIEQIKDYKVTLPIAFDWENWSTFNDYHLSFYGLTDMANTFLDTVHEFGYQGLLYSSKSYLEKLWFPTEYDTWLAHYTTSGKSNYQGKYSFWQMCQDGFVDGIKGDVDIDVMFLE